MSKEGEGKPKRGRKSKTVNASNQVSGKKRGRKAKNRYGNY